MFYSNVLNTNTICCAKCSSTNMLERFEDLLWYADSLLALNYSCATATIIAMYPYVWKLNITTENVFKDKILCSHAL